MHMRPLALCLRKGMWAAFTVTRRVQGEEHGVGWVEAAQSGKSNNQVRKPTSPRGYFSHAEIYEKLLSLEIVEVCLCVLRARANTPRLRDTSTQILCPSTAAVPRLTHLTTMPPKQCLSSSPTYPPMNEYATRGTSPWPPCSSGLIPGVNRSPLSHRSSPSSTPHSTWCATANTRTYPRKLERRKCKLQEDWKTQQHPGGSDR
ncbi:hypothetical protein O3P69_001943 [Scylla paramamosain]|uniref:Uncharacterized protein n=1 Tax=Scylla paramamosain TaxID=85552 RepID=A0AAW0V1F0_SCYPA